MATGPRILKTGIVAKIAVAAGILVAVAVSALAAPNHSVQGAGAKKDDGFQIGSPHGILIDADTGSVLFEKAADEPVYPASLAKLMTVELVFHKLKDGEIKPDDEYPVSEYAWRHGGAPSRSSTMFAALHSRVPVSALIRGVIVQSANDGCIILAEGIAQNELAWADLMTRRARELGMTKSVFTNSNGLPDPNMTTTSRDLAKLARYIIRTYPDLYPIFDERDFTWNKIRQQNRNPLLQMSIGADGLKTGYIEEAGYGLVGSAVQNGLRLIAVVNGAKSAKERAEDSRKLLEWGFRNFETRLLFARGETIGEAKLFGGAQARVPLVATSDVRLMLPRNNSERLSAKVTYTGPVNAPVEAGRPTGMLKVWRGNILALEMPLATGESVGVGTNSQRAFDAATELVINLFRAGAERL